MRYAIASRSYYHRGGCIVRIKMHCFRYQCAETMVCWCSLITDYYLSMCFLWGCVCTIRTAIDIIYDTVSAKCPAESAFKQQVSVCEYDGVRKRTMLVFIEVVFIIVLRIWIRVFYTLLNCCIFIIVVSLNLLLIIYIIFIYIAFSTLLFRVDIHYCCQTLVKWGG